MPKHPRTSAQSQSVSAQVYSSLLERARQSGMPLRALHVGDTYLDPPEYGRAENQQLKNHPGMHAYAPVQGEPSLRQAFVSKVKRRHDFALDANDVQVTAGATSAFNIVAQSLLESEDEVILLSPYWPLIRGIFATQGVRVVEVPFYTRLGEKNWDPEAAIRAAVSERTSAIYLNSPNNPSGEILSEEILRAILKIASQHDLWILCDEAYEDLYFDERAPRALWTLAEAQIRTIACHTISKSYAMAGTRVGFVHGPEDVMRTISGMQTFLTYCAPRPMQFAAQSLLEQGDDWLAQLRSRYAQTARTCAQTLGYPAIHGSTFLFFRAPGGQNDCREFLEKCADRGVLLAPGQVCGEGYDAWARLCFTAVDDESLTEALQRVAPLFNTGVRTSANS